MKNTWIIMKREILVRVRQRSFILLTLFGPLLFAVISIVPLYFGMQSEKANTKYVLINSTEQGLVSALRSDQQITFLQAEQSLNNTPIDALVMIDSQAVNLTLYQAFTTDELSLLQERIELPLLKTNLARSGFKDAIVNQISQPQWHVVDASAPSLAKTDNTAAAAVGLFASILIYLFIFMYGVQVLRAVLDEKQGRITEILISSVKPFQLMAGKIAGIGLVCLLQFSVWMSTSFSISLWIKQRFQLQRFGDEQIETTLSQVQDKASAMSMHKFMHFMEALPVETLLFSFVLYFIFSYLLYSALFAAIGAMIDNESDQQSFTFPLTMPLILTFILSSSILAQPNGTLAKWLSIIPFTSPIAMMMRIPLGVPINELILSLSLLMLTSVLAIFASARIFRTGILMYGKKATLREAWRWVRKG